MLLGFACIVLAAAQDLFPGNAWFHHGSYAASIVAANGFMLWNLRRRKGYAIAAFGATAVTLCALAAALLGPDTQTILRGPGENVALTEPAGRLRFPLTNGAGLTLQAPGTPEFYDAANRATAIGNGRTFRGAYVFWVEQHRAAFVDAADARGNHVTVTQPENSSFLSPVLLFAQTSAIAGKNLPVDTFAIPPLQRTVKAVLFAKNDVEAMATLARDPRPGILFAVEDQTGKMLPGAIKFARDGEAVVAGGVLLKPSIGTYPQVIIASAPFLPAFVAGGVVFVLGAFLALRVRRP